MHKTNLERESSLFFYIIVSFPCTSRYNRIWTAMGELTITITPVRDLGIPIDFRMLVVH